MEEIKDCIADQNTVETEVEARELVRLLECFLDGLTRENRVIFMRRYWFSASYEEIARITGLKEKAVSVRLSRIRRKLKEYLISNGETAVRWL